MVTNEQAGEETVEQKCGRLLFIGLAVTRLDKPTREMLKRVRPGGVILFGRNVESPAQVALLNAQIRASLDGLQSNHIVGCGKHFPGLGGSTVDSHSRMPVITHTWEQIFERDMVPF